MHIYRGGLVLSFLALTGCQSGGPASSTIADQFSASGRKTVDLASAVPGNWDRVCILGPYSSDAVAAQTLGLKWPAESLAEIDYSDGISLLLFVQDGAVTNHVEHPRHSGDFSNLNGALLPA